eukprot:Amastigsp_a340144_26.p2 type:complete len:216 gc:universal Amastigsp_a340144_26:579-1226(+)
MHVTPRQQSKAHQLSCRVGGAQRSLSASSLEHRLERGRQVDRLDASLAPCRRREDVLNKTICDVASMPLEPRQQLGDRRGVTLLAHDKRLIGAEREHAKCATNATLLDLSCSTSSILQDGENLRLRHCNNWQLDVLATPRAGQLLHGFDRGEQITRRRIVQKLVIQCPCMSIGNRRILSGGTGYRCCCCVRRFAVQWPRDFGVAFIELCVVCTSL